MRRLSSHARRVVDLRSDTVTRPSAAMRLAMQRAAVGDDVFAEDPTVNRLEEKAAVMSGKEASMFVASGTMSNLIAFISHAPEFGSEIICGDRQHTYLNEQGGTATLGGIHTRAIPNLPDGTLDIGTVLTCLRADDPHYARVKVVSVENTHNDCGGLPLSLEYLDKLKAALVPKSIPLHMDGARAGNAAVALGVTLERTCRAADTVSICLSKGMGAPIGSVLCGPKPFIDRARRIRKAVGGGWRQAGIVAAGGLMALEHYEETITKDHLLAKRLAAGLKALAPKIKVETPLTNMVFFESDDSELPHKLAKHGLLVFGGRGRLQTRIRAVVHCDVGESDIDAAVEACQLAVAER